MSHFSVLVITNEPDDVASALQPFHEYECTGVEDEYVRVVPCKETPEELEQEFQAKKEEYNYQSFNAFMKDYHGYEKFSTVWGRYTNPDARWDWWVVGGRWSGFFKPLPGKIGEVGQAGVFGNEAPVGLVDQIQAKDVDFMGMVEDARIKAEKEFTEFEGLTRNLEPPPCVWDQFQARFESIDEAREVWGDNAWIAALRKAHRVSLFTDPVDYWCIYDGGRKTFIERASHNALSTYAVVKDGNWYERGKMGWWGMASDEMSQQEWNVKILELLNDLDPEQWLTNVDCHI